LRKVAFDAAIMENFRQGKPSVEENSQVTLSKTGSCEMPE